MLIDYLAAGHSNGVMEWIGPHFMPPFLSSLFCCNCDFIITWPLVSQSLPSWRMETLPNWGYFKRSNALQIYMWQYSLCPQNPSAACYNSVFQGGCIITATFLSDFSILAFLLMYFHKNNHPFSNSENAHRESHPHLPYCAPPLREELECSTFISRSNEILANEQSAKAKFSFGDTKLADEEGRGRPSDFDNWALLAVMGKNESLTTRMLAKNFSVDHWAIVHRFRKLWKVRKLAEGHPRALRQQQAEHAEFSPICCGETRRTPFLNNLVILSLGMNFRFSSKTSKVIRLAFR